MPPCGRTAWATPTPSTASAPWPITWRTSAPSGAAPASRSRRSRSARPHGRAVPQVVRHGERQARPAVPGQGRGAEAAQQAADRCHPAGARRGRPLRRAPPAPPGRSPGGLPRRAARHPPADRAGADLLVRTVELSRKWYGTVSGKPVPLCRDKGAAQKLLNKLLTDATLRAHGVGDPYAEHRQRPLADHLADFQAMLTAKDNSTQHVELTVARVRTA